MSAVVAAVLATHLVADNAGRALMSAAITAMEHLTVPSGKMRIISGDLAIGDEGTTFRRMAPCVYGFEETNGQHLEVVDFSALTGAYEWSQHDFMSGGLVLTFEGRSRSDRARCFKVDGFEACQHVLQVRNLSDYSARPVIDAVKSILRSGCQKQP